MNERPARFRGQAPAVRRQGGEMLRRIRSLGFLILLFVGYPNLLFAHGVIGKRFVPEPLTILDPFPADEADLLSFSHFKDNDGLTNRFGFGISKRLSPNFAVDVEGAYNRTGPNAPAEEENPRGFENIELTVKYAMLRVPEHEFLATAGLGWEIGGTGSKEIGREPHSAIAPQLLFVYGLGDLPDGMKYLKPLAIAGQVGLTASVGNRSADAVDVANRLSYGIVIEYSLLYLQSYVKEIGIGWPFSRLVPIAELGFEQPLNGPNAGQTVATANPGVLWAGRYYELGVEAILPLNDRSGGRAGVRGLIHLFLDDLFPNTYTWTPFGGVLGPTQR